LNKNFGKEIKQTKHGLSCSTPYDSSIAPPADKKQERENGTDPLLARLLLGLELLQGLRATHLERLELLLLERPLVGDSWVLLDLLPAARPALLIGLLALLAVVLLHLAEHLVLLPQRHPLALALLALLHHLAAAAESSGGGREEDEQKRRRRRTSVA
jgi:hypothetical protein